VSLLPPISVSGSFLPLRTHHALGMDLHPITSLPTCRSGRRTVWEDIAVR
jgi:hypothetical protein